MMIKSGGLIYLFDFDGTLCGSNQWKGIMKNNIDCFKSGTYINPSKFDIRWSILTGRPKMDILFIKTFCNIHGLTPEIIKTSESFFYKFKNEEEVFDFKTRYIKSILDGTEPLNIRPIKIDKVVYIDNDSDCVRYINSKKQDYRYFAMAVKDFYEQKIPITLM